MADPCDDLHIDVDVSILVLAYNHALFIAECLDSLLAQDYEGTTEILVGEDCSTDGTAEVVARYAAAYPQVRVVTDQRNVGMHENNRRLLGAARGRYVAYCEGDDFWHRKDKLRLQVAALEQEAEAIGVHSDVDHLMVIDGHARTWKSRWADEMRGHPRLTTLGDLLRGNLIQTCSVLFRATAVVAYPSSVLAQGTYAVEDWPLFLHAAAQGPLVYLPEALATYRHVPGSMTNQGAQQRARLMTDQLRLLQEASRIWPEHAKDCHLGELTIRKALVRDALASGDRSLVQRAVSVSRSVGLSEDYPTRLAPVLAAMPGVLALMHRVAEARRSRREALLYR